MTEHLTLFYGLLFVVAFLYAAVGHGGASGYLALMAIYEFSPDVMKPTALVLNLFVSLISFIQFYRGGHFRLRLFLPLALASVPMSFAGGLLSLQEQLYKQILGIVLLLGIARLLFFKSIQPSEIRKMNTVAAFMIGGLIGFISGLIGIGGGIILSPVLLLLKWTDQKQTAAISALFIFVNSLAGLAGQFPKGKAFPGDMWVFISIAFAGGCCGAYFGSLRFNVNLLKKILAFVLAIAVYKLLFTNA